MQLHKFNIVHHNKDESQIPLLEKTQNLFTAYLSAWILRNGSADYAVCFDWYGENEHLFVSVEPALEVDCNASSNIMYFIDFIAEGRIATLSAYVYLWNRSFAKANHPDADPNDYCLHIDFTKNKYTYCNKRCRPIPDSNQ